ncbi:jg2307 [Pararge aegeria aegeria]|uniref:Jg2307 protein n=1 Tax=Pararge aegeria aegeria TaxID=348720 RepID=A0A8S4S8Z9_9NEOP|nr:jg2307 [Pararge aegeria aegeria]
MGRAHSSEKGWTLGSQGAGMAAPYWTPLKEKRSKSIDPPGVQPVQAFREGVKPIRVFILSAYRRRRIYRCRHNANAYGASRFDNKKVRRNKIKQFSSTLSEIYLIEYRITLRPCQLLVWSTKLDLFVGDGFPYYQTAGLSDSFDVVYPPRWGPSIAAFTESGTDAIPTSGSPASIDSLSYVSC